MPLDLASPDNIPDATLTLIARQRPKLTKVKYLEEFYDEPAILSIIQELDEHCLTHGVIGYHYTRAIASAIRHNGLLASTGSERRRQFLVDHEPLFTAAQRGAIGDAWQRYFDGWQTRARDGRVWFTLTNQGIRDGGATRLLRYFGGESIYMPLTQHEDIAKILSSIGKPLVVLAGLDASRVKTFAEYPFGKAWLSTYHCKLNPRAFRVDFDLYASESIAPSSILAVNPAEHYGWEE